MWRIIREVSIFKTLRFNFHYLKFKDAIKLPIIVSRHVLINRLRGKLYLEGPILRARVKIGFGSVPIFDRFRSRTIWNVGGGEIVFKGTAVFGQGTRIGSGGSLMFGNNFQVTAETNILCNESITFGDDVLCSWDCQIMDTDFHKIFINGTGHEVSDPVKVGDHVWIGSRVLINKGAEIPENCVIASGAVVTGRSFKPNTLIGGVPATVIKENINWSH